MDRIWKPHVTVAAIVERDGRFLMVEEQTDDGIRINQPAGHLEAGETLVEAVVRETFEETAHRFVPVSMVGVYQWQLPNGGRTYLRFAFAGSVGEAERGAVLDDGILRTVWLTTEELRACADRHRSPLVLECVHDWLVGYRCGLELIRSVR